MLKYSRTLCLCAGIVISTFACSQTLTSKKLDFIGEYSLATGTQYQNVAFGGISGLYYDDSKDVFYAISDASNTIQEGASRFYTLKMDIDNKGIHKVNIIGMFNLKNENGLIWPKGEVDAEGIAPTPNRQGLFWTSELGSGLRISDFEGNFVDDYNSVIPSYYNVKGVNDKSSTIGVRSGATFEGVSLTPDNKNLFLSVETALKQDGPIATTINSSPVRLLQYETNIKTNGLTLIGEYIYNLDPIPVVSAFGINDNGVSDILALDNQNLLFIERAGRNASKGYSDWDFNIRVYLAKLDACTNIKGIAKLSDIKDIGKFQPIIKNLLIDFSNHTNTPDNIEAISFGPKIDGHKTLIFASDNNFQPYQSNKFYLFIDTHDIL